MPGKKGWKERRDTRPLAEQASMFRVLGDPIRLEIITLIRSAGEKGLTFRQIQTKFPGVNNIQRYLQPLVQKGYLKKSPNRRAPYVIGDNEVFFSVEEIIERLLDEN